MAPESTPGSTPQIIACSFRTKEFFLGKASTGEVWFNQTSLTITQHKEKLVGLGRVELPTSPLSGVRSNQLSYRLNYQGPNNPIATTDRIKQFVWILMKTMMSSIKEVIQPQVPLRLPCYDFTPVMNHTVVTVLPKVRLATSGATHSHGVTGGVYKARERIHRGILIPDYSRFRLHAVELQTAIRTTIGFMGLAPSRDLAARCTNHCSTCVALAVRAMMT